MQKVSPPGKQIRSLIVRLNCPVLFTLLQSCSTCITQCNQECVQWGQCKDVSLVEGSQGGHGHKSTLSCCLCVSSFNNFNIWRLQELASMVLVPYLLGSMGWCKHYFHLSFYRSIKSAFWSQHDMVRLASY